jgi:hypothetical protein
VQGVGKCRYFNEIHEVNGRMCSLNSDGIVIVIQNVSACRSSMPCVPLEHTYTPLCFIKSYSIKQFVECECLGMMDCGLKRAMHNLRNLPNCLTVLFFLV